MTRLERPRESWRGCLVSLNLSLSPTRIEAPARQIPGEGASLQLPVSGESFNDVFPLTADDHLFTSRPMCFDLGHLSDSGFESLPTKVRVDFMYCPRCDNDMSSFVSCKLRYLLQTFAHHTFLSPLLVGVPRLQLTAGDQALSDVQAEFQIEHSYPQ